LIDESSDEDMGKKRVLAGVKRVLREEEDEEDLSAHVKRKARRIMKPGAEDESDYDVWADDKKEDDTKQNKKK
jgi:hypothetical protein